MSESDKQNLCRSRSDLIERSILKWTSHELHNLLFFPFFIIDIQVFNSSETKNNVYVF